MIGRGKTFDQSSPSGLACGLIAAFRDSCSNSNRSSIRVRSAAKISFLFGGLLLTTALTGCVGSSVNSTLDVAALASEDTSAIPSSQSDASSTDAVYETVDNARIPIPVPSPLASSQQIALAPTDAATPAEAAANSVIVETAATSQSSAATNDLAVAALNSADTSSTTPQAGAVQQRQVIKPQQTQKRATAFGGFFAKKPANGRQLASISNTPPAPSRTPSAYSRNGDLPGVKRNRAIFGVSEEEGNTEEEANVQVASVGSFGRLSSPNGLILQTERVQVDCFKPELLQILKVVERHYKKKVMVTSGYRSPTGNRRAGGVSNSTHIYCKAADIQVLGVSKWDMAKFLRTIPGRGGVGTYCRTESVHIDIGTQRDWHHPCSRGSKKRKA